jgi:hypothetical protein
MMLRRLRRRGQQFVRSGKLEIGTDVGGAPRHRRSVEPGAASSGTTRHQ